MHDSITAVVALTMHTPFSIAVLVFAMLPLF